MERLIREHRAGLDESMATVQTVRDREHLVKIIGESFANFSRIKITPEKVTVEPYGYDRRINWDTHLIYIKGYGVWGMANGPIT